MSDSSLPIPLVAPVTIKTCIGTRYEHVALELKDGLPCPVDWEYSSL